MSMPFTPLGRLRRYQDLLLLGGGVVITLVAFLMFAVTCVYAIRQFVAAERQNLAEDRGQVVTLVQAVETSLRRTVSLFELSWPTLPQNDGSAYAAFLRNCNQLSIKSPTTSSDVYFAASTKALDDPSLVRRYLALAQLFALSNASSSVANNLDISGYIYSPHDELIIMPASVVPLATRPQVAELIETLKVDLSRLTPSAEQRPGGFRRAVYWLPPFTDPLTGGTRVRLVSQASSQGEPFAVIAIEYDPQTFLRAVSTRGEGTYLIAGPAGHIIASRDNPSSAEAQEQGWRQLRHPAFLGGDVGYGGGKFVIKEPIGGTDWTLLHVFSWDDVAAGIAPQARTAAVAMAVILGVVWALLLSFRSRVFAPLLRRSERVFESENLSRTVVQTVPVGLALISRKSREWLLDSPVIQELGSRIERGEAALADALVACYDAFERDHPAGGPVGVLRQDVVLPTQGGGHVELACSASQARYKGIDVLVAVFIDVTERRRLQRELNAALEAADSANQAKSAFLAAMSHEIRTPLNAILGNLELLAHSPLTSVQHDRLATVRGASAGLLAVISDVLDFSKIEAGEMTLEQIEFNVLEQIECVLGIFEPLARARGLGLYARIDIAAGQTMWGDPTRVGQVLNNLLSNAIKFTEYGSVTVVVSLETASDGKQQLVLAIVDTGIGISPQHQEQLFTAFSQLDASINRRFGGTGLGLALCQRLVHAMHGRIDVSSTPDVGSRFTVYLPLGDAIALRSDPRIVDGARVLFLSSAREWCEFAVPHLEHWGAQVNVHRHPATIEESDLEAAAVLVIWGAREQWGADDENRLVEDAAWVVDGYPGGPANAICTGKIVSVSCLSLSGLAASMRATLLGEPLPGPSAATAGAMRADTVASSRGLKVLVAEDNAANRMLLAEQLTSLGCRVATAANGRQALERLDDDDWDVLLTDLNMPGMSGYQLAETVRARKPALPIVAITAHATKEERQRCEAAGMTQVMTKPISRQQLNDVMGAIAEERGVKLISVSNSDEAKFRGRTMPKQLWETFIKSTAEAVSTMEAARAAGDVDAVLAQLHSIRGALAVFGQASLAADCARVEAVINRDTSAPLPDDLDVLTRSLREMLDADA
ncbi:ATP-binding protein [Paraburkholderia denitrificans]|uniref:histidine kinase n=1 Tax=Paraburkholderia denitrificans TaxID=694025 RepID=A0ABW0J2W1_9BURK